MNGFVINHFGFLNLKKNRDTPRMAAIHEKKEAYDTALSEEKRMPGPGEFPSETQRRAEGVGLQCEMEAQPESSKIVDESRLIHDTQALCDYKPSGKLEGRKALITGGDSGIGRAVALFFAKEGADVSICYLPVEQKDAEETRNLISKEVGLKGERGITDGKEKGQMCELFPVDIQTEANCQQLIERAARKMGGLDLLVNNASYQMTCECMEDMQAEQLEKTFRTNVFAPMYLVKHALPYMSQGSSILFSTSIVAYTGMDFKFLLTFLLCSIMTESA